MTLASLGHDDIQYWLSNLTNREKILKELFDSTNHESPFHYLSQPSKDNQIEHVVRLEHRIKHDYEPEIFIDLLETIRTNGAKSFGKVIIWEIKPVLDDLGGTLRQIQKYKDTIRHHPPNELRLDYNIGTYTILIFNASKIPFKIIHDYFSKANVWVYQVLPCDCPRLESYNEEAISTHL